MRSSFIRLFYSCIIIVFSFHAQSSELQQLIDQHNSGEIETHKAVRGLYKEIRKDAKRRKNNFKKVERESSYLTCQECIQINELALIATRILLKSEEVVIDEALSNEVKYLKAITKYHNNVDHPLGDDNCQLRDFTDTHSFIDTNTDDEESIIVRSEIPIENIDALGIKRANKGMTILFTRPPIVNGKPVTLVRVFIPPEGPGKVTVITRDILEGEIKPEVEKVPPTPKKRKEFAYQYEIPGSLKVGPSLEVDKYNLPRKITILEFEDVTELDNFSIQTKSEISTRRQEASVGIKYEKDELARLKIKASGVASIQVPTKASLYDFDIEGAIGLDSDGKQTLNMSVDRVGMSPVDLSYSKDGGYQNFSLSSTKQFQNNNTVSLRLSNTQDDRLESRVQNGGSYNDTSIWLTFRHGFL